VSDEEQEQGPPSGVTTWLCGRCEWIKAGRPGEEIPEHHHTCRYLGTGKDPEPTLT
jgi:hypothetical protein